MKKILQIFAIFAAISIPVISETQTDSIEAEYQKSTEEAKKQLVTAGEKLEENLEKYGQFSRQAIDSYQSLANAYYKSGNLDGAIEYSLHALKVAMKIYDGDSLKLAKLYYDTGNMYNMHKQHPTAMLYMQKAAQIYRGNDKRGSRALADTYEAIASIYINLEDYKKSLIYAEKCLLLRSQLLPENDPAMQRAKMNVEFLRKELKRQ